MLFAATQPMGWPEAATLMVACICGTVVAWAFFRYAPWRD